jgi:hypothetical protein
LQFQNTPTKQLKPAQITVERLELYLNFLGGFMVEHSPEFDSLLPIYERLEKEISDRKASLDKMSLIRERVEQSQAQSDVNGLLTDCINETKAQSVAETSFPQLNQEITTLKTQLAAAWKALERIDEAVSTGRFIRIRKIVRAALQEKGGGEMTAAATIRKGDLMRYADVANKKGCQVIVKIGETIITVIPDEKKKEEGGIDYERPIL